MDARQIRWGLSGGVSVLAIAGFFWWGISLGVASTRFGWLVWTFATACQVTITAWLIRGAVALRRESGFSTTDLRQSAEAERSQTARVLSGFAWTTVGQTVLIAVAVWWCVRSGARDLVFPSIGLITSLHFVPLGRVFHVRPYYATAGAGTLISLAALIGTDKAHRQMWFGGAMAAVMWLSAWYVLRHATGIATEASRETWAV